MISLNRELWHLLSSALADFKRNKIRTFLTSLGIMIGVLSVVILIALGLGLRNYIEQQFENLGANIILVLPGSGFGGGAGIGAGLIGGVAFDEQDIVSLRRIGEVDYLTPMFMKAMSVESGDEESMGYVMGVNEEFFPLLNAEVLSGELWDGSDVAGRNKVVVLGFSLADKLYDDPAEAVNKTIRLDKQRFRVVGVMKKKGDNEQDNSVIIPYKTTYNSLNPDKTFWSIYLGVRSDDLVTQVKDQVENTLLKRYDEDDFSVSEQSEFLTTFNQIFVVINLILLAIGSISLIVGGIGMMNIMYATVTERTKEVGIRRAIGATRRDILWQFLVESLALSVFGGLLGLIFAGVIVILVRFFFPAQINLITVLVAFGVSSLIGVVFGVFPARRAANLPPIEAIRYE